METTIAPSRDHPKLSDITPVPNKECDMSEAISKQKVLTIKAAKPKVSTVSGNIKICRIGLIETLIKAKKSAKVPYATHE